MNVQLKHIGKSADDLRFFVLLDGRHAGGVTVHSVRPPQFSYGIAIAPAMRRKGIAKAALRLLLGEMARRGFEKASVQIAPDNAASLALHRAMGFVQVGADDAALTFERTIETRSL